MKKITSTKPLHVLIQILKLKRVPFSLLKSVVILLCLMGSAAIAQIPTNTTLPIVNGSGPFTTGNLSVQTSSGVTGFVSVGNLIDSDLATAATSATLFAGTGWIELDYTGGTFPAGSEIGFVVNNGLLSLALLSNVSIITYSDANPAGLGDGTVAETIGTGNLLGVGLASGRSKISGITTQAFRRVRLNFTGLDLGALLTGVSVFNAEVLAPTAGVAPPCNTPTALAQNAFPATATYGVTGVVGSLTSVQVANILNTLAGTDNLVSSSTADFATLSPAGATVAGDAYVSVKLLTGEIPANYFAGFDIENTTSLLSADLLSGMTVQALNNGTVVQQVGGSALINAALLGSATRQTIGFLVTTGPFDEVRLVLSSGLLGASATLLGSTNIYSAVVKSFCAPGTLGTYTILGNGHPTASGMGVMATSESTGLADAAVLPLNASLDNLVDADTTNYVELSSALGIGGGNSASVAVATPGHTFTGDEYVGFVVESDAGLIDVTLLGGLTITTYNNGVVAETFSNSSLLDLQALGLIVLGADPASGRSIIGFQTSSDFDEVELTLSNLAGVGNSLQVYSAFVSTDQALPVTFGAITASLKNGSLLVDWSTLSETNNKEFIIEGSVDGLKWFKIGTVTSKAAGGTSDVKIDYSFSKSLQEIIMLSGFSLISLFIIIAIMLAAFPSMRRKQAFIIAASLSIVMVASLWSCSKGDAPYDMEQKPVVFVRVGQIDQDGKTAYSKVVKVEDQH
ncbi:hypothetical protein ABDK00_002805 [Niabella insulamsoli]|uniref:hypothetical protein n=1 Tax=Niabella insulamsoli TaxID=3144874 RepID=UPI0031FD1E02